MGRKSSLRQLTLRAAREAAETTGVVSWLAILPLSILLILRLLFSPWSRKNLRVLGFFGFRGIPLGRALLAAYCLWMTGFDGGITRRGGRPISWVRFNPLTRLFRSYFRAEVTYDFGENEPVFEAGPCVIGIHPHGVLSLGVFANSMFHQILPAIQYRVCTIPANFKIPFWRDFLLALGFVDSGRDTIKTLLDQSISVGIVVGGADEALNARPHTADLTLETRLGFVRIALEHGASLLPVYTFGENEVFRQLVPNPPGSTVRKYQDSLKAGFGYSMPMIVPAFPQHTKLHTVVGYPIALPLIRKPTLGEVIHWHGKYVTALQQLFDKYQPSLAPELKGGLTFADHVDVVVTAKL